MLDIEEAAGSAAVDDLVEGVGLGVLWVGVERDVLGGEALVVVGGAVAASFFADVFVGGSAVFEVGLWRRWGGGIGGGGGFDAEVMGVESRVLGGGFGVRVGREWRRLENVSSRHC